MLKVLNPGFYSSIQDAGRFGYRGFGVPVSGVMDTYSYKFANSILGNNVDDAVVEMTMVGGTFQFTETTIIAISGADMNPQLNSSPVQMYNAIRVNNGDILKFGRVTKGLRTYLAVKNGLQPPVVLGSQSQFEPITKARLISKNDTITYSAHKGVHQHNALVKYNSAILQKDTIEVFKGPEFNALAEHHKNALLNSELTVANLNNRMAYQLEPLIKNNLKPILTSPVLPGTVQLTPKGNLIVLMRDCQTTGGYPRVLQFTEEAINILSQKTTGNTIKIRLKG